MAEFVTFESYVETCTSFHVSYGLKKLGRLLTSRRIC
jgi:hypothetical protein